MSRNMDLGLWKSTKTEGKTFTANVRDGTFYLNGEMVSGIKAKRIPFFCAT
jgi:hypothetical protein